MFVAADGTPLLRVEFERGGDCPPAQRDGACTTEDTFAPFDCPGATLPLPTAGKISVAGESVSKDAVPDDVGGYLDTSLAGLTAGVPLHIHAAGAEVPAFDADVTIPSEMSVFVTPMENAVVSRSGPLDVAWTATDAAPISDVRVFGRHSGGGPVNVLCAFPPTPPAAQVPTTLLGGLDPANRAWASLKPAIVTTVAAAGWDIDVLAEGPFDLKDLTIAP